jgi:putative membrane protein
MRLRKNNKFLIITTPHNIMNNIKESFMIFLRGVFMGIADAIPGVSGGTIALITGIYQRLIHGINNINTLILKEIVNNNIKKAITNIKKIDFPFFIPLILGIAIALLTVSHIIGYLLTAYTSITYAFFLGLILISALFVYKQSKRQHEKNLPYIILGFIFSLWFTGLTAIKTTHSLPILFLAGAIAICAMILPGISGAFILVLLNQYEFMINSLKNILIDKLAVFIIGGIVGILSFSNFLDYLLKKHKSATMSFLTGLMIGSLRIPYEKIISTQYNIISTIIAVAIGIILVLVLEKKFSR